MAAAPAAIVGPIGISTPVNAKAPLSALLASVVACVPELGVVVAVVGAELDDVVGAGVGVLGMVCPPPPPGGRPGELALSACADVIEIADTKGTLQAAATPTTAPRLSIDRRLSPVDGSTSFTPMASSNSPALS
jgi:hypothetical protein